MSDASMSRDAKFWESSASFESSRGFAGRILNGRAVLTVVSLWLIWGVVYSANLIVVKQNVSYVDSIWYALSDAIIWVVLTPMILCLVWRFPIRRSWRFHGLLIHLPLAFVGVAIHECLDAVLTVSVHELQNSTDTRMSVGEYFRHIFPHKWYSQLVIYGLIIMVAEIVDYQQQLTETRSQLALVRADLAESRLRSLRQQIRPHFLFNCLNTISGLVEDRARDARQMIGNLAKLLRTSLECKDQEISFANEMKYLRIYLQIEQMRFGERLEVHESIQDAANECPIPAFLLQPLVENAIQHGLNSNSQGGKIEIRADADSARLKVVISDNGIGIQGTQVEQRIGLTNTACRLRELYGTNYRFEIRSRKGEGTIVVIELPVRSDRHWSQQSNCTDYSKESMQGHSAKAEMK